MIWGELSISKMGELDIGVNRLDTVLPAKLYAEDELKIQQKALRSRENTLYLRALLLLLSQ